MTSKWTTWCLVLVFGCLFSFSTAFAKETPKAELGYEAYVAYFQGDQTTTFLGIPYLAHSASAVWYAALTPRVLLSDQVKLHGKVPFGGFLLNVPDVLAQDVDTSANGGVGDFEAGLEAAGKRGRLDAVRVFSTSRNPVAGPGLDGWRFDGSAKLTGRLSANISWFNADGIFRDGLTYGLSLDEMSQKDDTSNPDFMARLSLSRVTFGSGASGPFTGGTSESDAWQLQAVGGHLRYTDRGVTMPRYIIMNLSVGDSGGTSFGVGYGFSG
ncbi:MAG TPA: hypothetical protein VNA25_13090 [Phycisphaerae bacterium]|nr:hypothetical protein [Phycisphaerae bacterium]